MIRRLIPVVLVFALFAGACDAETSTTVASVTSTTPAEPSTTEPPATAPPAAEPSTTEPPTTEPTPTTTEPGAGAFPVVVTSAAGSVTIEAPPQRIVALSATHVEMLFAIGGGSQLIAGDLFSNYPEEALALEQIDSFNLNVEAVIALEPDLVILTFDPGEAVQAFDAVGIPSLLFDTAATLDDAFDQLATVGAATGHLGAAQGLVANMQAEIDTIAAEAREWTEGVTYYHEIDPFSFFTPNSSSFIGQLYGLLGMENIADEAPDEFGSGFPQVSPEFIIAADPNVIVLAAPGEDVDTLVSRQGWDTMTAIQVGNVAELDADAAGRWGPRVVDVMRAIADAVVTIARGG